MTSATSHARLFGFLFFLGMTAVKHTHAVNFAPTTNNIFLDSPNYSPVGPLEDVSCNVEDLEQANDLQLFVILQELRNTTFFRNFVVDLDHKCPLQSWRKGGADDEEEEEEEFHCEGSPDIFDDEEAEPACHVDVGSSDPFSSNALFSMATTGFESKDQKDTFKWQKQTDMIVASDEPDQDGEECGDDNMLPDDFWVDICSNIIPKGTPGEKVVNLALNPEKNTAYNGTHIWDAIYQENCLLVHDQEDNDMCLEERVLYRLLSGLHTSTTLSIAMNYYPPSKKKGRTSYEANPNYFMEKFHGHPEYLRNLHFTYVVLLRALQKAAPTLQDYEIRTGDIVEDETARVLLQRLLDSAILSSCSNVFSAFDESVMFQNGDNTVALRKNFKGVFHNVSSILDCVQCQQCKLHGKMAMLGYGTALKVLFMPEQTAELSRNEIVALINTIAKMSESIRQVRELTQMYWENQQEKVRSLQASTNAAEELASSTTSSSASISPPPLEQMDVTIGAVANLGRSGHITWEQEQEMVQMALRRQNPELYVLAKHYGADAAKFFALSQSILGGAPTPSPLPDAIVVGSGLAGLSAALNILDRGGTVVIVEKEHLLGGNSNKASSGINAYVDEQPDADTLDTFRNDTTRSAGEAARPDLIDVLVTQSGSAVTWLRERVGVDLSLKAQLGGHSSKRTHRPSNGMAGAEIIYGVQKAVKAYQKSGKVQILLDTRVTELITEEDGKVVGVACESTIDGAQQELRTPNVILATGGFAADRSNGSYLEHYRPELLNFPTTAGAFSTGDGVSLATSLGAGITDMDKVQVHPTGWVDPEDPENTSKILAAELMRGVGGILLNKEGKRFANELGTRAYVTQKMLSHDSAFAEVGKWNAETPVPTFSLVLSSSAAQDAKKHVDLYSHKGLLTKLEGVSALAKWMGLPKSKVVAALQKYQDDAGKGVDEFGKTAFRGVPAKALEKETFYAGTVTPVLHYCMGGITIDTEGYVLNQDGKRIPGLNAAGEVTGGVHGVNRLGGNSLLECTVFGSLIGRRIEIQSTSTSSSSTISNSNSNQQQQASSTNAANTIVTLEELEKHNTEDDCWVAIHGVVYDLTEFAEEHPAGPESIWNLAGKDGTEAFAAVHNKGLLDDYEEEIMGRLG